MASPKKRKTELDLDMIAPPEPAEPSPSPPPVAGAESLEGEAPPPASRLKLYIIIGIVAAVLLLGSLTAAILYKSKAAPPKEEKKEAEKAPIPEVPPVEVEKLYNFTMEPFTIPSSEEDGKRFMRIGLAIQLSNEETISEVEQNLVILRESVYVFLTTHPMSDFTDLKKRDETLDDLKRLLDRSLQSGRAKKVLITELSVY